jgi:hypothetical protein
MTGTGGRALRARASGHWTAKPLFSGVSNMGLYAATYLIIGFGVPLGPESYR